MTDLHLPDGTLSSVDPMSEYEQRRAALLAADTTGYQDPHFTDKERDRDEEAPLDDSDANPGEEPEAAASDGCGPDADGCFRIRPRSELDAQAAMLLGANPELSFEDALQIARQRLQAGADAAPSADTPSQGVMQEMHPLHQAFHESARRAASLVPQHPTARQEFLSRLAELDGVLEKSGDPLHTHPNKPLILAQMAAREMRGHTGGGVAIAVPVGSAPRMTAPLAGGTASTNTSSSRLDRQIGDIRYPEDYHRVVSALLGARR